MKIDETARNIARDTNQLKETSKQGLFIIQDAPVDNPENEVYYLDLRDDRYSIYGYGMGEQLDDLDTTPDSIQTWRSRNEARGTKTLSEF